VNKYRNTKLIVDGEKFDSKGEADRYFTLRYMLRAGWITDLRRQQPFELLPSVKYDGESKAKCACKYIADFTYYDRDGNFIVEDFKGFVTDLFSLKRHMMKSLLGIDIKVTSKIPKAAVSINPQRAA